MNPGLICNHGDNSCLSELTRHAHEALRTSAELYIVTTLWVFTCSVVVISLNVEFGEAGVNDAH